MLVIAGVAAVAVVSNAIIALAFLRVMRGEQRQHARERDALIDKVCHLAGRPWNEAPAAEFKLEEEEPNFLISSPERLPDW